MSYARIEGIVARTFDFDDNGTARILIVPGLSNRMNVQDLPNEILRHLGVIAVYIDNEIIQSNKKYIVGGAGIAVKGILSAGEIISVHASSLEILKFSDQNNQSHRSE